MDINTGQIIDSLQKQLDNHNVDFDVSEVGEVIMVGDGVARVQGLENVLSSEMVELPNGVFGMAMNLEEENVGIVLFGDSKLVKEGDIVKRTYKVFDTFLCFIKSKLELPHSDNKSFISIDIFFE